MSQVIHLQSGLVVYLREGFSEEPLMNDNGEPEWRAEAIVAGELDSEYAVPNDRPGAVRIKVVGRRPEFGAGSIVRLDGRVIATQWSQPRQPGVRSQARTNVTINAERVEDARGQMPETSGGIPIAIPAEIPLTVVGQADGAERGFDQGGTISISAAKGDVYNLASSGVMRFMSPVRLPVDAWFKEGVRLVDPRLYFIRPDAEDVSQRNKAKLILTCQGVELPALVGANNGHRPKRNDPAPVVDAPPPSDG